MCDRRVIHRALEQVEYALDYAEEPDIWRWLTNIRDTLKQAYPLGHCVYCGVALEEGALRQQKYCKPECQNEARKARRNITWEV